MGQTPRPLLDWTGVVQASSCFRSLLGGWGELSRQGSVPSTILTKFKIKSSSGDADVEPCPHTWCDYTFSCCHANSSEGSRPGWGPVVLRNWWEIPFAQESALAVQQVVCVGPVGCCGTESGCLRQWLLHAAARERPLLGSAGFWAGVGLPVWASGHKADLASVLPARMNKQQCLQCSVGCGYLGGLGAAVAPECCASLHLACFKSIMHFGWCWYRQCLGSPLTGSDLQRGASANPQC